MCFWRKKNHIYSGTFSRFTTKAAANTPGATAICQSFSMLLTWIVSFYPYNNSVEIGIIFLITIYRNENWVPKNKSWWTPHSFLSEWVGEVAQSCLTLCDPMDCSLPGSSLHGILQARIQEWVAISFSRGSSRPRDRTQVSCIPGRCFNLWATREALWHIISIQNLRGVKIKHKFCHL